jgi:hypothetical protein
MENDHQVLFSRSEDGLKAIRVETSPDGSRLYRVRAEDGLVTSYPSARQMLVALTGHPQARHWTFERYFRQGRFRSPELRAADMPGNHPTLTVLDSLFDVSQPLMDPFEGLTLDSTQQQAGTPQVHSSSSLTIMVASRPQVYLPEPLTIIRSTAVGIDLKRRGHEVAKLFYAGFGAKLAGAGLDPEEVLQEVYRGLLVRNMGKCPWDPAKSSFGHYVHMVCGCIVSNVFRRENRRRAVEQVGISGRGASEGDEFGGAVDVASEDAYLPQVEAPQTLLGEEGALNDLLRYIKYRGTPEARAHADVLRLMKAGFNRAEAAERLGLPSTLVSRLYTTFQDLVIEWANA